MVLWVVGVKLNTKGLENVNFSQPSIFVCNHQSFIDIAVMMTVASCDLYFVAKHELRKVPFLGWYMKAVGMIFVKRGSSSEAQKSLVKAGDLIRKGKCVILFPEGTRSKDGKIGKFKKGAFHLALEAGVDIVPIAMQGGAQILPSNPLNMSSGLINVRIGKPISLENYSKNNLNDLLNYTEKVVNELYVTC